MTERKRILFMAEAVTLAHVARPMVLAAALEPDSYQVIFACDPRYKRFFSHVPWTLRPISSISSERFLDALAHGRPIYDTATLRQYVREDVALLEELRPDLVVGDFRLSLSVSARTVGIPYMTITSAHWSPFARLRFPLPGHPMTRVLGLPLARLAFHLARPFAFAYHCLPLNQVRREYRLPFLGLDLRRVYTDADCTLYADIPEMVPTYDLPRHHHYLGALLWSPPESFPDWWGRLPENRPVIYVTLGSSGQGTLLPVVFRALAEMPYTVVAATAGQPLPDSAPGNAFVANYLPGEAAAARSSLVICNGGSATSQQALAAGVPVLGIASNMDQFLNMQMLERLGAGLLIRADRANSSSIRESVAELLGNPDYAAAAARLRAALKQYPAGERFASIVADTLKRP